MGGSGAVRDGPFVSVLLEMEAYLRVFFFPFSVSFFKVAVQPWLCMGREFERLMLRVYIILRALTQNKSLLNGENCVER